MNQISSIRMSFYTIKIFYWVTFHLSIVILFSNFGIGIIALSIIIIPVFILHLMLGLNLNKIARHQWLIILSACNLLTFTLIRPDGVHTTNGSGLSVFLNFFGIDAGFNSNYETHFLFGSLLLLAVQLAIELVLRKLSNQEKVS